MTKIKKKYLRIIILSTILIGCSNQKNNEYGDSNNKIEQSESLIIKSNITKEIISTTLSSTSESTKSASTITTQLSEELADNNNLSQSSEEIADNNVLEDHYYILIKEAQQKQIDYINTIEDPNIKQSVQTSHSAAISKSNAL